MLHYLNHLECSKFTTKKLVVWLSSNENATFTKYSIILTNFRGIYHTFIWSSIFPNFGNIFRCYSLQILMYKVGIWLYKGVYLIIINQKKNLNWCCVRWNLVDPEHCNLTTLKSIIHQINAHNHSLLLGEITKENALECNMGYIFNNGANIILKCENDHNWTSIPNEAFCSGIAWNTKQLSTCLWMIVDNSVDV